MEKKTVKAYELYLNEFYSSTYNFDEFKNMFAHYDNGRITGEKLWLHFKNQTSGKMIKKYDPIAFYAGFHDWEK